MNRQAVIEWIVEPELEACSSCVWRIALWRVWANVRSEKTGEGIDLHPIDVCGKCLPGTALGKIDQSQAIVATYEEEHAV